MKRTAFGGAVIPPVPVAGRYIYTASATSTSTSSTLGTGVLRVAPWLVPRTLVIDRIGAEVTTIGDVGSKLRIGIYADTGAAYPGALLLDAGQIAGDSATVQELTVSATLSPGVYWLGAVVQSVTTTQPTVRTIASSWFSSVLVGSGTTIPAAGAASFGYTHTGITAALPTPFTTTPTPTGSAPARIFVRAA